MKNLITTYSYGYLSDIIISNLVLFIWRFAFDSVIELPVSTFDQEKREREREMDIEVRRRGKAMATVQRELRGNSSIPPTTRISSSTSTISSRLTHPTPPQANKHHFHFFKRLVVPTVRGKQSIIPLLTLHMEVSPVLKKKKNSLRAL